MSAELNKTKKALEAIKKHGNVEDLLHRVENPSTVEPRKNLTSKYIANERAISDRLAVLKEEMGAEFPNLTAHSEFEDLNTLNGHIENFIGFTKIPTGVIGPLTIKGTAANDSFYIPMATHEGALIASYHRGARAITMSGGASSVCLTEGVQRSPVFKFKTISDVGRFILWILEQQEKFKEIVCQKSNHAQLESMDTNIEGNHIILTFDYTTGDAAGQNMVTICTQAIVDYILENTPIEPINCFVESNYSGDKKASAISFSRVRGKKVTTEVVIPKEIVESVLKTKAKKMYEYWIASTIAVVQSGAIGAQGHYANGLAAMFMACGQDAACVSEASVGITRMEELEDGSLYASITIPNLIVGTIGGGTSLPTPKECLELLGCYGLGKARKFAEVCGGVILAGELSIAAALSAGHFTKAHQALGRKNGK